MDETQAADPGTSLVSIRVLSVTPMHASKLFALVSVEIDIDGIQIAIHGIRALDAAGGTRIELPQFRDQGGTLRPTITVGILYAWGLGVPQNRAMARQLFAQIGGYTGQQYIDLLDNNLLPRTFPEVRDAMGRLAILKKQQQAQRGAQEARDEAAREAAAEKEARLHPSPTTARNTSQARSTSQGCSFSDVFYTAPSMFNHGGGMITGMWAGNGCH
jgi:hypothetical protein